MLRERFANWIKRLHKAMEATRGRGSQTELRLLLGVDQADLSNWLAGKSLPNPQLDNFERMLRRARPKHRTISETLEEILAEDAEEALPPPSRLFLLGERYADLIEAMLRGDPSKAERILLALEAAEGLHLTELLADVARLILTEGPEASAIKVSGLLRKHPTDEALPDAEKKRRKTQRSRILREFRKIG